MEASDHPYPVDTVPFPSHTEVLKYYNSYADRFDLRKHIKFGHLVIRIKPIENDKWEIIVKDLPNNQFEMEIFDAVFVCNGHFASPRIPDIAGASEFQGKIIHSYEFRVPEKFCGDLLILLCLK